MTAAMSSLQTQMVSLNNDVTSLKAAIIWKKHSATRKIRCFSIESFHCMLQSFHCKLYVEQLGNVPHYIFQEIPAYISKAYCDLFDLHVGSEWRIMPRIIMHNMKHHEHFFKTHT